MKHTYQISSSGSSGLLTLQLPYFSFSGTVFKWMAKNESLLHYPAHCFVFWFLELYSLPGGLDAVHSLLSLARAISTKHYSVQYLMMVIIITIINT
jgi:hypothetical protein